MVAGPSGSGKTTTCGRVVSASPQRGLSVSGLVTWVERTDGGVERWVQDLRSSQRRLLAREAETQRMGSPRWRFSSEGLLWGDQILAAACPTDVLVIDEVGPLELLHGSGWRRGVLLALAGPFRLAVVAVRPPLVSHLLELVGPLASEAVLVTPGRESRDTSALDCVLAEAAS